MLREIQVTPVIGPKPSANPKSLIERYRGMVESLPDVVADARIGEFIRSTANRLVQSPELMEFFYRRNSLYKKENPIYAPEVDRFEKHVEADIDNLVRNCNTLSLNEKQLLGFFKLSEG